MDQATTTQQSEKRIGASLTANTEGPSHPGRAKKGSVAALVIPGPGGSAMSENRVHGPQPPQVLNNFVSEVLNVEFTSDGTAHTFVFDNPRRGWIFFRLRTAGTGAGAGGLSLDDGAGPAPLPLASHAAFEPQSIEVMRFLPEGRHEMLLTPGSDAGREIHLVVRTIPAILFANYPYPPHLQAFGRYDWHWLKRIGMLDVCNTIITEDQQYYFLDEWLAAGKHVLQQVAVPGLQRTDIPVTAQDCLKFWSTQPGMTDPRMSGLIIDEFIGREPFMENFAVYVEAIQRLRADFPDKVTYPYITGPDGLKTFVEPLRESGCRYAYERYLAEQPTEEEDALIRRSLKETIQEFETFDPDFAEKCIMVLGLLSGPNEMLNLYPDVSFKAFLDMQFHFLATDPSFPRLYGIEEYTSGYADEEYLRLCARLFRHYCIEGSTERFVDDPYRMDHLDNADFTEGLDGWTVSEAEPSSITTKSMQGYGFIQGRYQGGDAGDTFLWMKRGAKKSNRVSQTLRNLMPGRVYSAKMISADYGDMTRINRYAQAVLEVEGADLFEDKAIRGPYRNCYSHHNEVYGDQTPTSIGIRSSSGPAPKRPQSESPTGSTRTGPSPQTPSGKSSSSTSSKWSRISSTNNRPHGQGKDYGFA